MKSIYEFLLKNKTVASTQGNDYVDLGLPSGLLWAKCNIGAKEPTDYGDYFMWGSTKPNTNDICCLKTCPFNDGKSEFNKEYFESMKNKICPNGILAPKYDTASIIMGDEWRLPADDDFNELINNTNHKLIKNYQDSKVNGMLFTPMVSTSKNNKSAKANSDENYAELFIPASGILFGSSFWHQDDRIFLWSSSLYMGSPNYARCFVSNGPTCYMHYSYRYNGFCMRGVMV